jgi:APA family basic amino acid/polyamine antiporter
MSKEAHPTRLSRRLGVSDAVGIGLGAMLGAGAFAAPGPAAELAGSGILLALALAGFVAFANATSTARLAAVHPSAGGVYAYGRARISATAGFTAGWAFTAGKISSLVAMALTFGAYATPGAPRIGALAAVVALTLVNLAGVTRTAAAAKVGAAVVVAGLLLVCFLTLGSATADGSNLKPVTGDGGLRGILGAAGILFFAFAGYARIATLGEEVREPERTIPRAVPIALAIAFALYAATNAGALAVLGATNLSHSKAALVDAVKASGHAGFAPVIRTVAAIAALGVLLSLLAGVARTVFAMADDGELPRSLSAVHGERRVPHIAQAAVGAIVALAVLVVPTISAIATSSVCILTYYSIAHLSALRLSPDERRPSLLAPVGLIGCAALILSLPIGDVLTGLGLIAAGLIGRFLTGRSAGGEGLSA